MLPEDFHDIVLAFILLIILIVIGSAFHFTVKDKEDEFVYTSGSLELKDEEEMFLLNYLRTNAEDKTIADLIILSENNEELIKKLKTETGKIIGYYTDKDVAVSVVYPNGNEELIYGDDVRYLEYASEQVLPSLNKDVIKVRVALLSLKERARYIIPEGM